MADPEAATAVLERLKAICVRLAIDDFGVGTRRWARPQTPVDLEQLIRLRRPQPRIGASVSG
ncbi:MAG: hypothetical protein QOK21_1046 [Solirubrobacteraceae bacterium]|jgi:hypothetical protein|nr:hypothetical protein [Solirubrobacteraceae bacterium]